LELAAAEDEVARGDLVAERLANLPDAERQLAPHRLEHVVEVHEDPLRGLRPQVGQRRVLLDRPHERLEHEVELARRSQLSLAAIGTERSTSAAVAARLARRNRELVALRRRTVVYPRKSVEGVGPEAMAALPAVDHRIREVVDVPARLPDIG